MKIINTYSLRAFIELFINVIFLKKYLFIFAFLSGILFSNDKLSSISKDENFLKPIEN